MENGLNYFELGAYTAAAVVVGASGFLVGGYLMSGATVSADGARAGLFAIGLGLVGAYYVEKEGAEKFNENQRNAEKIGKDPGKILGSYRYVRFIPDTLTAIPSTRKSDLVLGEKFLTPILKVKNKVQSSEVILYFSPN